MDILLKNKLVSLIDLTNLNEAATEEDIINLCKNADVSQVAAVCVDPQHVKTAQETLKNNKVAICTVANFPHGTDSLAATLKSIEISLKDGATEIDMVLPYKEYLSGKTKSALNFIKQSRVKVPTDKILKIILETGVFTDEKQLYQLCRELIDLKVNFLKTSTGKIAEGASLFAARILLQAIKDSGKDVGFKVSGGIRTIEQALSYYNLAKEIFSENWITANHFRFGASALLELVTSDR